MNHVTFCSLTPAKNFYYYYYYQGLAKNVQPSKGRDIKILKNTVIKLLKKKCFFTVLIFFSDLYHARSASIPVVRYTGRRSEKRGNRELLREAAGAGGGDRRPGDSQLPPAAADLQVQAEQPVEPRHRSPFLCAHRNGIE